MRRRVSRRIMPGVYVGASKASSRDAPSGGFRLKRSVYSLYPGPGAILSRAWFRRLRRSLAGARERA